MKRKNDDHTFHSKGHYSNYDCGNKSSAAGQKYFNSHDNFKTEVPENNVLHDRLGSNYRNIEYKPGDSSKDFSVFGVDLGSDDGENDESTILG